MGGYYKICIDYVHVCSLINLRFCLVTFSMVLYLCRVVSLNSWTAEKEFISRAPAVFKQLHLQLLTKKCLLAFIEFFCIFMFIITPASFIRCLFSVEMRNLLYSLIVPLHILLYIQHNKFCKTRKKHRKFQITKNWKSTIFYDRSMPITFICFLHSNIDFFYYHSLIWVQLLLEFRNVVFCQSHSVA